MDGAEAEAEASAGESVDGEDEAKPSVSCFAFVAKVAAGRPLFHRTGQLPDRRTERPPTKPHTRCVAERSMYGAAGHRSSTRRHEQTVAVQVRVSERELLFANLTHCPTSGEREVATRTRQAV